MNTRSVTAIEKELIDEIAMILGVEHDRVKPEDYLHELGVDSLGLVEILVFIERSYSVNLMESGLTREDFQTIRSLARRIASALH